jgi:hypothetical protein
MLNARWFGRVWVVQEVVRSSHTVTIRYGHSSVSWERFSWFILTTSSDATELQTLSTRIGYSGLNNIIALRNVSLIRRFTRVKNSSLSLLFYLAQMFRSGGKFDAEEPKDRVYGILGLSLQQQIHIQPGHQITPRQLFVDIVEQTLKSSQSADQLEFLNHAGLGYKSSILDLPSWAPDWSIKTTCKPFLGSQSESELFANAPAIGALEEDAVELMTFGRENTPGNWMAIRYQTELHVREMRCQKSSLLYNATPGRAPDVSIHPGNILEVEGCKVDRIVVIGSEYPPLDEEDYTTDKAILSQWVGLVLQNLSGPLARLDEVELLRIHYMFFRTILHGRSVIEFDYSFSSVPKNISASPPPEHVSYFWEALQKEWHDEFLSAIPDLIPDIKHYTKDFRNWCTGRCFGITEKGYMGLFLPGSQKGDSICLISGARMPFNLRMKPENSGNESEMHELVGPAYIEGLMNGHPQAEELIFEKIKLL